MIVLIPAYEPDHRMLDLIDELTRCSERPSIVVIDDGSGPAYTNVFHIARFMGCTVLSHAVNVGKGAALKTGFEYIERTHAGQVVVCADSDGQHRVADILRVANEAHHHYDIVLGARHFTGNVPAKSRIGNAVTTLLFRSATGCAIRDTQTGLRAYPASILSELQTIPGERFEYELNVLLHATREQLDIREVDIETVYLDGNASTHFRPVVDSARIYKPLFAFMASSLLGFVVDVVALLMLSMVTGSLLASVIGARLLSATCNFTVNRRVVFATTSTTALRTAIVRYFVLAVILLAANFVMLTALTHFGVALLPAKLLTELLMVAVSYTVQRHRVFATPRSRSRGVRLHVRHRTEKDRSAHAA